jgi:hypothetical protein
LAISASDEELGIKDIKPGKEKLANLKSSEILYTEYSRVQI